MKLNKNNLFMLKDLRSILLRKFLTFSNSIFLPSDWSKCILITIFLSASYPVNCFNDHQLNTQPQCPSTCRCAEKNSLMICHRSLLTNVPPILETTILVDLDYNSLSKIYNNSFSNCPKIEILSLQDNGILHLEAGSFAGLAELMVLRLGKNHLSSLPNGLFANNKKLQDLDLHENYLSILPDQAMFNLISLQVLNVSFNRINTARLGPGFHYTSQLSVIDLTGNELTNIDASSFNEMKNWNNAIDRKINLSYCKIKTIHPHVFKNIPNLVNVDLSGNAKLKQEVIQNVFKNIKTPVMQEVILASLNITDVTLLTKSLQSTRLTSLSFARNKITTIEKSTFFFLHSLKNLDLSYNDISLIENLAGLAKLENLNLAHNNLEKLTESMMEGLHDLITIDISNNRILVINNEAFANLFNINTIDISHNRVHKIIANEGLESLETLKASWNRLNETTFLIGLRQIKYVDLSHNLIKNISDEICSRGQQLKLLNFSENYITHINDKSLSQVSIDNLDLSNNKLTKFFNIGLDNVDILHLNNNSINEITPNALKNLIQLQEINLQHNNLRNIPLTLFQNKYKLKKLNIAYNPIGKYLDYESNSEKLFIGTNQIEVLNFQKCGLKNFPSFLLQKFKSSLKILDVSDNQIFKINLAANSCDFIINQLLMSSNNISYIDSKIISCFKHLQYLDVSSNPFNCDCKLLPFVQKLYFDLEPQKLLRKNNYKCYNLENLKEISLEDFIQDNRQNPNKCNHNDKKQINLILYASIISSVLIIFGIVMLLLVWRFKKGKYQKTPSSEASTKIFRYVDERSLTSSSNSSSNNSGGSTNTQSNVLLSNRQWV